MKMSLPDAVKSYLSMVKRKQSTRQLMAALERGGYPTRSKNFYTTVFGVLNRHASIALPNEKKRVARATEGGGSASEDETKDPA